MKKIHWMQTDEGKKRMSQIQKKAWRTRRKIALAKRYDPEGLGDPPPTSKAEKLIRRKIKRNGALKSESRSKVYGEAATLAATYGEWPLLLRAYFHAGMKHMEELQRFIERGAR